MATKQATKNYQRIPAATPMPDLIEIQLDSFALFQKEGNHSFRLQPGRPVDLVRRLFSGSGSENDLCIAGLNRSEVRHQSRSPI